MKKICYIFIMIWIGCHTSDKEVFNADKWKAGDQVHYEVERLESDKKNDSILWAIKTTYKAELEVNKTGETNELTWIISGLSRKPNERLSDLQKKMNDTMSYRRLLKVIYCTNKEGQYQEILNWPDVQQYADSAFSAEVKRLGAKPGDKKDEAFIRDWRAIYMKRPALEESLLKELKILHAIYGHSGSEKKIKLSEEKEGILQLLAPNGTIQIIQKDANFLTVRITQTLDSMELQYQIDEYVKGIGSGSLPANMSVTDSCVVVFNKLTGWANRVSWWRHATIGDRKRFIELSLKQVEN